MVVWLLAVQIASNSLYGTVRAADSDAAISGVRVEVDVGRWAVTDPAGRYTVAGLAPGPHTVRFSRLGYRPRAVDVLLGGDQPLRLDVVLRPSAVALRGMEVEAVPRISAGWMRDTAAAELGARYLGADGAHSGGFPGGADALRTLASLPDVATQPEGAAALHVRGGSADELLVLLDGIPLYNPYHSGSTWSAVNADVLSRVSIHTGVVPARFGNALSGVVELNTLAPQRVGVTARGGVGLFAVRQTVAVLTSADGPSLVLSGRRNTPSVLAGFGNQTDWEGGFGDRFAKATLPLRSGELEVLSFAGADSLAFDGGASASESPTRFSTETESGENGSQNGFAWSTTTNALIWRAETPGSANLVARAWRTHFAASALWQGAARPVRLASALDHLGASAEVARQLGPGEVRVGVGVERWSARYEVGTTAGAPDSTAFLGLHADPLLVSAFVEDRWPVHPKWTLSGGLRAGISSGYGLDLDPRITLRFHPTSAFAVSAGYARTHQYVQSLRNEESILDAVLGISLPVVAERGSVPVARADQYTAALEGQLTGSTTLAVDGYLRRLEGLVLVAPVSAQPFALDAFAVGNGRAAGTTLRLLHRTDRLAVDAGYAFTAVSRSAGERYAPSFARAHSLQAALGYEVRPGTSVQLAFQAASGRPTSVVADAFSFEPRDPLRGTGDLAGSPYRRLGPLNGERLPPYVRLDLGVRHTWRRIFSGREMLIDGVLDLNNLTNRENVLGIVAPAPGIRQSLNLLPRSLSLGLEWRY